ncbi:hypothetical protein HIM_07889 [Hirsutella minnesotensis 3608]|uniref:Zn(2)-C6 fungal-type domain-containing protein n=1 Tax=Hirsutella minnesotensis 3608 TaxID=1043627 RepID=A0A0F7ZYL8_9HYPO|nr:hypothetical protein HIM_07889 [Hirsutella minnesotensis 3608]
MFGTWKYDPETDEVQNLRKAYDPITARSSQHQACNRCHEKKLKCSGEKKGCDRCAGNGHLCEYTRSGSRSSRKSKKTSRPSTTSPPGGRESSGSPCSQTSRKTHSPKSRSGPSSERGRPTTTTPSTGSRGVVRETDFATASRRENFNMDAFPEDYSSPTMPHLFPPQQFDAASSQGWTAGVHHMQAVTTAGIEPSYVATSGPMYDANGNFMSYTAYSDFDNYSSMDPRYWAQGQH